MGSPILNTRAWGIGFDCRQFFGGYGIGAGFPPQSAGREYGQHRRQHRYQSRPNWHFDSTLAIRRSPGRQVANISLNASGTGLSEHCGTKSRTLRSPLPAPDLSTTQNAGSGAAIRYCTAFRRSQLHPYAINEYGLQAPDSSAWRSRHGDEENAVVELLRRKVNMVVAGWRGSLRRSAANRSTTAPSRRAVSACMDGMILGKRTIQLAHAKVTCT